MSISVNPDSTKTLTHVNTCIKTITPNTIPYVNCVYFNKINRFVLINKRLDIFHMDLDNNIFKPESKYNVIRLPHSDYLNKYDLQMVQNDNVLLLLLDSRLYYSLDGCEFAPVKITVDHQRVFRQYKKIKFIKSFNDKIFAYGTNILLESDDGIMFKEFNKFDEIHDIYRKNDKYYYLVSMERLLSAVSVPDYRLDIYSKNNDVYVFEQSLDNSQSITTYNVKNTQCSAKDGIHTDISISFNYINRNNNNIYLETTRIRDVEYGYIDNIIHENTLRFSAYVNDGFTFTFNESGSTDNYELLIAVINNEEHKIINEESMSVSKFSDERYPVKLYCVYVNGCFEVICLFDYAVVHQTIKLT